MILRQPEITKGKHGPHIPARRYSRRARNLGLLTVELMVAMAIVVAAMLPFLSAFVVLHKSVRVSYQRAVAMEIIDGEMEILAAGEWREFKAGAQPYALRGRSSTNLPPGKAVFTVTGNHLRLEWLPEKHDTGGKIVREAVVK